MSGTTLPPADLVRLAFEAAAERATERLPPLLSPDVRIVTERGAHEGIDAVLAWAAKGYDHLDRRFVLERLEPRGEGYLGSGRVEYVWREGGEVGDSAPMFFAIRIADGLLAGLALHEDEAGALTDLGA